MTSPQIFISEATKQSLASLLMKKAQTPKPLTVRELSKQQKGVIRKMYSNGHSWEAIASVFGDHSLTVSAKTVETLLSRKKKADKGKEVSKAFTSEAEQTVTQIQAESIIAEWQRLSEVRVGFTKQELVAAMADDINAVLKAGYSYSDVAQELETRGVKIAVGSLRKYHRAAITGEKKKSDKASKTTTVSPSANTSLTTADALTEDDSIFAEGFENV